MNETTQDLPYKAPERRGIPRMPADARIELFKEDRQALSLGPDLLDIHERGFQMRLCDRLEPGESFLFQLRLPEGPVEGVARLRWIVPRPIGFLGGAQIESIHWLHAGRFKRFLRPGSLDPLKVLDRALLVAAAVAACAFMFGR